MFTDNYIKLNERLKKEFDDISADHTKILFEEIIGDYDLFNKWMGIQDNKKITKTPDTKQVFLIKKLKAFYKKNKFTNPIYHFALARKFSLSLWDKQTPIDGKKGKLSPAQIIYDHLQQSRRILVLKSQTGTGKSVLVPQIAYHALNRSRGGPKKIICTQPRRLNAMDLARFVAGQMSSDPGELVGYDVGGEKNTTKSTKIVYQTIGKLLQDIKSYFQSNKKQPLNKRYECFIFDEVHERDVTQDILMGFLAKIPEKQRPHIIIMSATFDPNLYQQHFGRTVTHTLGYYPPRGVCDIDNKKIKCKFLPEDSEDYIESICKIIEEIHQDKTDIEISGILVFLSGSSPIRNLSKKLGDKFQDIHVQRLTRNEIEDFKKNKSMIINKKRKVILATNVAETGITFPGITHVIDSGWKNINIYDPETDSSILVETCISQDNAIQRRGRIGRISGPEYKYHAVFTGPSSPSVWSEMRDLSVPQIYTSDITSVVLMLRNVFPNNSIFDFNWIDRPSSESVAAAMHKLYHLGAIDISGQITEIGKFMDSGSLAKVPMPARRALYTSWKLGVGWEMSVILAMMQEIDSLFIKNDICMMNIFANYKSDHISLLNIYQEFLKYTVTSNIKKWCEVKCLNYDTLIRMPNLINEIMATFGEHNNIPSTAFATVPKDFVYLRVLQSLFSGFFMQTAKLPDKSSKMYMTSVGVLAKIDNRASIAFTNTKQSYAYYPDHIFYTTLSMTRSGRGIAQYKMNLVSEFNTKWFGKYAPDYRMIT